MSELDPCTASTRDLKPTETGIYIDIIHTLQDILVQPQMANPQILLTSNYQDRPEYGGPMPKPLPPATGLCPCSQTSLKNGQVCLNEYASNSYPGRLLLLRRPIMSLDVLPLDVCIIISEYLSVKDLVLVMKVGHTMIRYVVNTEELKVNKRTRETFSSRSIWVLTLKDILRIRPIPRLLHALPTMAVTELVQACACAYRLERVLGGNVTHRFTLRKQLDLEQPITSGSSLLVPGGRYFVLFLDYHREVALFETESGRRVMEMIRYKGTHNRRVSVRPKIIPVSASEFLLGHISSAFR